MADLFGQEIGTIRRTNPKARASELPGPIGETCGTCEHAFDNAQPWQKKRYYKCEIARREPTKGSGSDIRLKDAACSRWEKEHTQ